MRRVLILLVLSALAAMPAAAEEADCPEFVSPARREAAEAARKQRPADPALKQTLGCAHLQAAAELMALTHPLETGGGEAYAIHMRAAGLFLSGETRPRLVGEIHRLLGEGLPREALERIRMAEDPARRDYVLLLLKGRAAYDADELPLAREAWEEALELNPASPDLAAVLAGLREKSAAEGGFERRDGARFTVKYDREVDPHTSRDILRLLEEAYAPVCNALETWPSEPLNVLVYADADFESSTGMPVDYIAGLFDGQIRIPLKSVLKRRETLPGVLAHETAHAVIHVKSGGRCGRWMHEGTAQLLQGDAAGEGYMRRYLEAFRRAGGAPPPFDYPSALLWAEFLRDAFGFARINDYFDALRGGAAEDAAWREAFGFGEPELRAMWMEHLEKNAPLPDKPRRVN